MARGRPAQSALPGVRGNAWYNDSDPFAAQWLRNLGAAGAIPAGHVDGRSILDVEPSDLRGFAHCHFFAGIGGWAYALQLAGWPLFDLFGQALAPASPSPPPDDKARRVRGAQSGFQFMADGFWYRVANVRAEWSAQAMSEVSRYAENAGCRSEEVLSLVRQAVDEEQVCRRKAGRPDGFPAPEVLFAFLRNAPSAFDRAANDSGCTQAGAQEHPDRRMLRDLRQQVEADAASLRRESVEQLGHEPSGSLPALSQFLARCCEAGTDHASGPDAGTLPLIGKVAGRVGLLRGSGNAVVPQVAALFIRAVMEAAW